MLSFGEDLARLAGEIVSGHESRTAAISGIRTQVRANCSTHNAKRADARAEWRTSMAGSAAARNADLNQRSAGVRKMRQENQAGVRDDTAILRLDLGSARQQLAGDVGALRQTIRTGQETIRTGRAKTAADLHKNLSDGLAKARADMRRQFAAARAVWPAAGAVAPATVAPAAAPAPSQPERTKPAVAGSGMRNDAAKPPVAGPAIRNDGPQPTVGDAAMRNDKVAPASYALDVGVRGMARA